ncbi:hydantoin utilization protein A [Caenibius tardaugens NBRC 16725]|uniref:Hydantoin utilization protein A n=1 Tax=Caenibius tardaugens NBRC 16725 TaxID=1219035 RepID=U2ZV66_9SPHN|nr:hydantoinase/oxoprolinase family protein [Caenibius tardaugens]AZI36616.1 hydantoinase/oxoprolinase family protein [Caenibius tardaugens NBRC 16725]GAD49269.1 hydantoin utilization protein A [Caenibius tardaugens NBRC 16725]
MGLLVSIDNGGTLTDICAFDGTKVLHAKTLTTPHDLTECLMAGLTALASKTEADGDLARLVASIDHLRYSTTQGTNAIAQRKGPRVGLIVNSLASAERIEAAASDLFATLVGDRFAVVDGSDERVMIQHVRGLVAQGASRLVVAIDGEDAGKTEARLRRALYAAFPRHLLGAVPLLFSTALTPGADLLRRGWSGLINAFLHPSMEQFLHHAEDQLRRHHIRNPLLIFRNDGGSTRVSRTVALQTYSSGPRGGVEGGEAITRHYGFARAVSIDIGGTTTDLAYFNGGRVAASSQGYVESAPIAFALAEVPSVAAGGGSILSVVDGVIRIGPESVGALPGPACFGRGGTAATITDVMLLAEVIDPASYFGGQLVLDRERAARAVSEHLAAPLGLSLPDAVAAAIAAYDNRIAEAVAALGAADTLLAFGGAGPMSACGVAEKAGIDTVLIPRFAAVFSAFGIGFSPIRHEHRIELSDFSATRVDEARAELVRRAERAMTSEGFALSDCRLDWRAIIDGAAPTALDDVDANARGVLLLEAVRAIPTPPLGPAAHPAQREASPSGTRGNADPQPLFRIEQLAPGDHGVGPCIVEEEFFTCRVPDGWSWVVTGNHDLFLEREGARP